MATVSVQVDSDITCPANSTANAIIIIAGTRNSVSRAVGYRMLSLSLQWTSQFTSTMDISVTVTSPGCKTVSLEYVNVPITAAKTIKVRLYPR